MRRLVFAGLLYLTGIAIVLVLKPQLMFREDGHWKEFGIGRDSESFTPFPFWLFTILWSLMAYVFVLFIEDSLYIPNDEIDIQRNSSTVRSMKQSKAVQELPPGYYILNEGSTGRDKVPRYVYLGEAPPE
jgi:hypothetical protein